METLPRKIFVPRLISTAMPMVAMKRKGSAQERHMINRIIINRVTAVIRSQAGISEEAVLSFLMVTSYPAKVSAIADSMERSSGEL